MSYLLIDPPVGPFSKPEDIESWLGELDAMTKKHTDGQPKDAVAAAKAAAEEWLRDAIDLHESARSNSHHAPAGSPEGGQFTSGDSGGGDAASGNPIIAQAALRDALQSYLDDDYTRINGALREGRPLTGQTATDVAALDAAIAQSPPFAQTTAVYRAVSLSSLGLSASNVVGASIHDRGYMSTSAHQLGALIHVDNTTPQDDRAIFHIDVPKGMRTLNVGAVAKKVGAGEYVARTERERILPRGTKLTVTGREGDAIELGEKVAVYRARAVS